jgi:hypothetical protein
VSPPFFELVDKLAGVRPLKLRFRRPELPEARLPPPPLPTTTVADVVIDLAAWLEKVVARQVR